MRSENFSFFFLFLLLLLEAEEMRKRGRAFVTSNAMRCDAMVPLI